MEIDLSLNSNDPLKRELSKEAGLRGISLENLIAEILKEYVENEIDN